MINKIEPVYTDIKDPQDWNPPNQDPHYENIAYDDDTNSNQNDTGFQEEEEEKQSSPDESQQFNEVNVNPEVCINESLVNLNFKEIEVKSADPGSPPFVIHDENSLNSDADSQSNVSFTNQAFDDLDTGSFFDYGVPLSGYSSDASFARREKSTDGEDSLASYSFKHERKHSVSSTDTMMGEDEFKRYLEETNSVSNEYLPGKQVFDSNSALSSDEEIVYDLVSSNQSQDDKNQVVIFLGQRTSSET